MQALAGAGAAEKGIYDTASSFLSGLTGRLMDRQDRESQSELDYNARSRLLAQEGAQRAAMARLGIEQKAQQAAQEQQRRQEIGNSFLRLMTDKKSGLIEEMEFVPDLAIPGISAWGDDAWEKNYPGKGKDMAKLAKPRKIPVVNQEVLSSWLASVGYDPLALDIVEERIGDLADSPLEAEDRYKKDMRGSLSLMGGQRVTQQNLSPLQQEQVSAEPRTVYAPDSSSAPMGDAQQIAAGMGVNPGMLDAMLSQNPGAWVNGPNGAQWAPLNPQTGEPDPNLLGALAPQVQEFFQRLNQVVGGSAGMGMGAAAKSLDPMADMTSSDMKKLGGLVPPAPLEAPAPQQAPEDRFGALFQYLQQP